MTPQPTRTEPRTAARQGVDDVQRASFVPYLHAGHPELKVVFRFRSTGPRIVLPPAAQDGSEMILNQENPGERRASYHPTLTTPTRVATLGAQSAMGGMNTPTPAPVGYRTNKIPVKPILVHENVPSIDAKWYVPLAVPKGATGRPDMH